MTGTLTITGRDRQYLLMDLWDVPGLGEHIREVSIYRPAGSEFESCVVSVDSDQAVPTLLAAIAVMDDTRTSGFERHVMAHGEYRGVPVTVMASYRADDADEPRAVLAALRAGDR